jgi:pyruvate dehydrogenase E2 component (dihydrolipoamide acetyltransferase)
MEVETDKATVEIEAPADGILAAVTAQPGDVVPVGQRIALIIAPGEVPPPQSVPSPRSPTAKEPSTVSVGPSPQATPVAARIAAEHHLDLSAIKTATGRVRKEDVLAHLAARPTPPGSGRVLASPKARRLAAERSLPLASVLGTGPQGAILAADVEAAPAAPPPAARSEPPAAAAQGEPLAVSRLWRIMAERVTQAWTTIPHFYLLREANASALAAWRAAAQQRLAARLTYTDLLVKLLAAALRHHPRLNAGWQSGAIVANPDVNVGLAVAVEDGLVVPVIHHADRLGLSELAERREALAARAQAGKLSPADLSGGTFTLSNLGMYGVDAFSAIINPPQAAILAVGRIAERVVASNGQPVVQPMLTLSLSCDHRVVDGARAAQFLQTLAELVEAPMRLLD